MFNKSTAKISTDPLDALRAEIAGHRAAVDSAKDALGAAVLDSPTGDRVQSLRSALAAAVQKLADAEAALTAAERTGASRAASTAAKAAAKDLAERWETAKTQGLARVKAARALEVAMAAAAKAAQEIEATSLAIAGTNLAYDSDGAMLTAPSVQNALRFGMAKAAGMPWIARADKYLLENLPPISERFEAAHAHLLSQKVGQ